MKTDYTLFKLLSLSPFTEVILIAKMKTDFTLFKLFSLSLFTEVILIATMKTDYTLSSEMSEKNDWATTRPNVRERLVELVTVILKL
jgi:hypothetical protein